MYFFKPVTNQIGIIGGKDGHRHVGPVEVLEDGTLQGASMYIGTRDAERFLAPIPSWPWQEPWHFRPNANVSQNFIDFIPNPQKGNCTQRTYLGSDVRDSQILGSQ